MFHVSDKVTSDDELLAGIAMLACSMSSLIPHCFAAHTKPKQESLLTD